MDMEKGKNKKLNFYKIKNIIRNFFKKKKENLKNVPEELFKDEILQYLKKPKDIANLAFSCKSIRDDILKERDDGKGYDIVKGQACIKLSEKNYKKLIGINKKLEKEFTPLNKAYELLVGKRLKNYGLILMQQNMLLLHRLIMSIA